MSNSMIHLPAQRQSENDSEWTRRCVEELKNDYSAGDILRQVKYTCLIRDLNSATTVEDLKPIINRLLHLVMMR